MPNSNLSMKFCIPLRQGMGSWLRISLVNWNSELEESITQMGINSAIKKMKPGKAPGPDGFPIEFF